MSERTNDHASPRQPQWVRRLRRARLLLAGVLMALLLLLALDLVTLAGAIIVAAVVIVAATATRIERAGLGRQPPRPQASRDGLRPGTQSFAQSLPDPCFILATDGTVRYANDLAVSTFGIETGDLLQFRLRHPELVAAFSRVTRGEGPQQVQFVERIPTERTYMAWFAALERSSDAPTYLLILDDLTEAKATERMRVDFVANASHELRTPLASLAGFVETLQGPAKDDPEARERFLAVMHEQAMRMSRLIDDLLSLSRIEMRAHVLPRQRIDLVPLLHHVIDTMTPLAREMNVEIEAELPEDQVRILAEQDELVQVFNNLIENACKYGQSGGRVVVKLETDDFTGSCSVAVIDFGPGIAPEHLPRLTERFYRVDADESRRHRGTGLGLAIVKHILSRHRARMQIDSRPGAGARFVIHFPSAELILREASQEPQTLQLLTPS